MSVHEPTGFGMVPNMPGRLTPYEIAVYVALTWRTSFDTGSCWPSHKSIADDACMSEASVKRALAGLRDKGLVTWTQRRDAAGDLTSNVYTVRAVGGGVSQSPPGVQGSGVGSEGAQGGVSQSEELDPMNQNQVPLVSDVPSSTVAVVESTDKAEARRLAEYLSERLGELGVPASRRVVTEAWVTEVRRMIQRDMRSPESIRKAIDWAMADSFWCGNIQSPSSLRKHYDKMRLQAQRGAAPGRDSQQRAVADEAALTGRPVADVRAEHMATIQRGAEIALAARRRTR